MPLNAKERAELVERLNRLASDLFDKDYKVQYPVAPIKWVDNGKSISTDFEIVENNGTPSRFQHKAIDVYNAIPGITVKTKHQLSKGVAWAPTTDVTITADAKGMETALKHLQEKEMAAAAQAPQKRLQHWGISRLDGRFCLHQVGSSLPDSRPAPDPSAANGSRTPRQEAKRHI